MGVNDPLWDESKSHANALEKKRDQAVTLLEELIGELLNLSSPTPVSEELMDRLSDWTTGESWK